jgi:DNA gyrase subunit A
MIGANIGKFLMDVAGLVENRQAPEIVDISNMSSKEGIRIVLELKKGADVERLKNLLYKKTRLEDTFGVNMLAICDGKPETMGLKQILKANVDFQYEVATRKYTNLLAKELDKKEIQEGLIRACNVIDLIIEILRGSKDRNMAKACLVEGKIDGIQFKSKESKIMATQLSFTEKQANAILEMRLYKLIGLEIEALIADHEETLTNIFKYEDILARRDSMTQVLINDMEEFKTQYKRARRTTIENGIEAVFEEAKQQELDVYFLLDRFGYAKTIDEATFERNKEAALNENRFVFKCKNTGKVCLFTDKGQLHTVKVMDVPFGKFRDKSVPVDNISTFSMEKEKIILAASQSDLNLYRVLFFTKQGMCKLVDGGEFDVAKRNVAATKLQDDDEVVGVEIFKEQKTVVLQSADGYFLRFGIDEIPEKKKAAVGVRAIKLVEGDTVSAVYCLNYNDPAMIEYKSKQLELNKIKLGKRDSKGVKVRA